jgi:DNA-binding CsgD family transcriptional regulator/tetratricopeptide (TPR) repeat protein
MAVHQQQGWDPAAAVFVGRRAELSALEQALESARAGRPQIVMVEGEAGIGKTALIERFIAAADEAAVVRASGDASESELAFGVAEQILLRAGVPIEEPLGDHITVGARILELLGALDDNPVILFVDDAHWADQPSLRALLFVVRRLVADRVLVVIATRDGAPGLPEGLTKAAASADGCRLGLQPLDTEDLRALAEAQGVTLSVRAAQRLEAHAGGNPLYSRALLEELPAEAWHRHDQLPAPRSFAALVVRRVEACPPEVRRLLEAVAVLGPRCSLATAAGLGGVEEPFEALDLATSAGLLQTTSAAVPTPSFVHPLIGAAVYENTGPARRAQLHAEAAALVEEEASALRHLAAASPGPDDELAARMEQFAERTEAGHLLELAAGAMVTAARLSAERGERQDRLLRAVDWMLVAGDAAQARTFAEEIARFEDGPRRSSVLGQLAELEGHDEDAARLLAEAWDRCDPKRDPVLAATVAHRNAYHHLRQLRDGEVVTWGRRALGLAPTDVLAVGWAGTLALSLWRQGRARESYEVLESAATGDEDVDLHLRGMRGWLRFADDDLERGRTDLEAAVTGELRLGALLVTAVFLTELARLQYVVGDWADAVVSAEQALALAADAEHPHSAFVWWAAIAVPAARGDWPTADEYARRAAAEPPGARDRTVAVGMALALHAAARGDHQSVLTALDPVAAMRPNPAIDEPGCWPWQDLYGEALVALGRAPEADAFLAAHETLARERGRPSAIAKLARVRGRIEAALGRREQAASAFATALEHIEPLTLPYEAAMIHFAHGQFLRRNGQRRAAAKELTRAREALEALEARPALERCDRELVACGLTPVKRSAAERPDLTPQEEAVARLVVTGRTNREVAGELLLSVKTVEVHLTHIYAKLGISSRTQLAVRAVENPGTA